MYLRFSKKTIYYLAYLAAADLFVVIFHVGGSVALRVGQFSPLSGAFLGGSLALLSVFTAIRRREQVEPWIGNEKVGWMLIGLGMFMWGIGDTFWRYYISIGQTPFPSSADIGYSAFPLLMFAGLLFLPRPDEKSRRVLLVMDSLISMGSILAIAWYLLLGSLAQLPGEVNLAKFLGLYYPLADTALLSCVIFLLLRGQAGAYQSRARRVSLLVVALGLCFFIFSDFVFNVQNNAGTYVEATWIDLGWPLGMVTIGIAAYLRRFLPVADGQRTEERQQGATRSGFSLAQFIPYALLGVLLITLIVNILSNDSGQIAIRPVLLYATVAVIALVVVRQIITLWDNIQLAQRQAEALEELERANQQVAEQSHQIAERNAELEHGIAHLAQVQAQLANGNLRVRAMLRSGVLLPLAGSLNIMAERLMRVGQENEQGRRLAGALHAVLTALDRSLHGAPLSIPESCSEVPEVNRLLMLLRLMGMLSASAPGQQSRNGKLFGPGKSATVPPTPTTTPLSPRTDALTQHHQPGPPVPYSREQS